MKRFLALTLCALFLALPALAQDYTLEEKLFKQVKDGSGLKVNLRFEKTGGGFSVLDEAQNAILDAALPGSEINLRYLRGVGTIKGKEDLDLVWTREGKPLADLRLLRGLQNEAVTSSLLGGLTYTDRRDGSAIRAMITGKQAAWPMMEGVLLRFLAAESTWQTDAAQKLEEYGVKLSVWLSGFTTTEQTRNEAGRMMTSILVQVPAQELKRKVQSLLGEMYQDADLLALLAREMTGPEAAAYLQPGMLQGFVSALDSLPLTGELISQRLMDEQGNIVSTRMTLPMGGAWGLDTIVYENSGETDGQQKIFLSLFYSPEDRTQKRGRLLVIDAQGSPLPDSPGSMTYAGTLTMAQDPAKEAAYLTSPEADAAQQETAYAFNLFLAPDPEAVDAEAGTSSRHIEVRLVISPKGEGQDLPAPQVLSLALDFNSRLRSAAATYVEGSLVWQDQGSQAQITAHITGNTAAPWVIPEPDAAALRLDGISREQAEQMALQAKQSLQAALAQMMLKLNLPKTLTDFLPKPQPIPTLSPTQGPK